MTSLEKYSKPSVAVDLAIMTVVDGDLCVLLVDRPEQDVAGWAMPGGFVHMDEAAKDTVERVLREKVGINAVHFEQLATYGALGRDPRGRVISIVYLALCPRDVLADANLAKVIIEWQGEVGGPAAAEMDGAHLPLAFDHAAILGDVVKRLRGKLDYTPIGFALLPKRFTLRQVQDIHEAVLGRRLTKPPFRRKLLDRGMIVPTGAYETGGAYRPAELYEVKTKE